MPSVAGGYWDLHTLPIEVHTGAFILEINIEVLSPSKGTHAQ